jgi:hypothetical protein
LELAKRVQNDLQPKPLPVSPSVDFAASALAADHVGGDFHDVFETATGRIAIVLGDVSGKGVPAALLVSVLHGAIRSSSGSQHETACERINRMLCERTASERYATLFWGVFDANSSTLRYVYAGHPAPMLLPSDGKSTERLNEGGPVLGVLASTSYTAGVAQVEAGDMLIVALAPGSVKQSVAPRPCPADSTHMRPPCRATMVLQIASPSPERVAPVQALHGLENQADMLRRYTLSIDGLSGCFLGG